MIKIIMCLLGILIVGILLRFMFWPLLKFAGQFIKWIVITLWAIPILVFLPMLTPFYLIIIACAAFCEVTDIDLNSESYTDCSPLNAIMDKLDEINAKL